MNVQQLRSFLVTAEEEHFHRAAVRLGISQPALSQQIRALEAEVGGELFLRLNRRVTLTEAGRVLQTEGRRAVSQLDHALRQTQSAIRGHAGSLVLGFTGANAAHDIVPEIVRTFRERFPAVELVLQEMMSSGNQVEALRNGDIHLGFFRVERPDPVLEYRKLLSEPLMAALPQNYSLSEAAELSLADLADTPFIFFPRHRGPELHDRIIAACMNAGFSPRIAQEAVLMQTTLGLVAAGIGAGIVPASAINLQRRGVVYRPIRDLPVTLDLFLVHRREPLTVTARAFVAIATEVVADWQVDEPLPSDPSLAGADDGGGTVRHS